jgi:hypothetical protein
MACWLVTVTSVLRTASNRAGFQASPGGGRTRLGEYHFWKNRSVLGVEKSRGLRPALICSSDGGQTRMWKNNQKTAVTNVHVFMLRTPRFQRCYRRGLSHFLSVFAGHRRGSSGGARRRFHMNRCISIEISCFSGVRSSGGWRAGNTGRISTGKAGRTPAKIFLPQPSCGKKERRFQAGASFTGSGPITLRPNAGGCQRRRRTASAGPPPPERGGAPVLWPSRCLRRPDRCTWRP